MKNPIVLGAVVLGLLAAVVTFLFFKKKNAPPPTLSTATATYVVAKEAIPPRKRITTEMIEVVSEKGVQDGAFCAAPEEVIDKSPSNMIPKGEKIKKEAIAGSPKVFPIPGGMRGIALFFDPNVTIAGLINLHDRVDVLVVYPDGTDNVARTVAQDCEIISMDVPGAAPPEEGKAGKEGGKAAESKAAAQPAPATTQLRVVLAVTPQDAVKITAATGKATGGGDLRLALRNPEKEIVEAKVEEEWEHPHRVHKHYPFPAPASPENIPRRSTGPSQQGAAAASGSAGRNVVLPPGPMGFGGMGVPGTPKSKEKTVEVIRGTTKESVPVKE